MMGLLLLLLLFMSFGFHKMSIPARMRPESEAHSLRRGHDTTAAQ